MYAGLNSVFSPVIAFFGFVYAFLTGFWRREGAYSIYQWISLWADITFGNFYNCLPGSECQADMSGKVVIITGANSGLGQETARFLWSQGATVVLACRCVNRGYEAVKEIEASESSNVKKSTGKLIVLPLDLASLSSVRSFCSTIKNMFTNVHVLVLNAGLLGLPKTITKDGCEMHFQVHHLSHFLLTVLLAPRLISTKGSRIVVVSSVLFNFGEYSDDLNFERSSFSSFAAYANSKLHNILFTRELSRRLPLNTTTVNACHPGTVLTNVTRTLPSLLCYLQENLAWWVYRNVASGAGTQIKLAMDPSLNGVTGKVFKDYKYEMKLTETAANAEIAEKLWDHSVRLTNLKNEPDVPTYLL